MKRTVDKVIPMQEVLGVDVFHVIDRGDHVELSGLYVVQGRGIGGRCIRMLKALHRPIRLCAVAQRGRRQMDLLRFYTKHGFKLTRNPAVPNEMEWTP